jgi:hypothetical protein
MRAWFQRLRWWAGWVIGKLLLPIPRYAFDEDVADALQIELIERRMRSDTRPLPPFEERLAVARRRAAGKAQDERRRKIPGRIRG